jgi:tetratricopeptide (TPR) repeat protein
MTKIDCELGAAMLAFGLRSSPRSWETRGMRRFVVIALCGLIVTLAARAAQATDYALLIGAGNYSGGKSGLRNLNYSRNDVVELEAVLRECGYRRSNITLMYDGQADTARIPEYAKIRHQFDLILKDLAPEDTVIVALAGHGVQFANEKTNYFCPLDADPRNRANLISLDEVYQQLRECKAARKLLLVDACRDDAVSVAARGLFEKMKVESVTRPQIEGVPEQTIAIFSCQAGQRSWEHSAISHGIFFYHVLRGLRGAADTLDPDARITVGELADYVKEATKAYARNKLNKLQTPLVRSEGDTDWVLRRVPGRIDTASRPLAEANRLRMAGDFAAARQAYDRAIAAKPNDAKAHLGRGLVLLEMKETSMALHDFREAVRLDPTNASAWMSLGGTQGRAGRFAEAAASYSEALKHAPDAVGALTGRGAAQLELGRVDAALQDLNRALTIAPDNIDAWYNRARAHQQRGDAASSQRDLDRAKALERPGR